MQQIELKIDVSAAVELQGPVHIAASIVLPDRARLPERPVLCFAKPSSAYSRGYYTYELPGPAKGAQARWHADRGWIFAALDTLGCGDSSRHDPQRLDFATLCAAAHAAEQEIRLRLANGVLAKGFPAVPQPVVIGIGHAAGGSLVIYQQAHHRSYDGVAILGFSAVHSHPPTPPGGRLVVVAWYSRDPIAQPLNAAELEAGLEEEAQQSAWDAMAWGFHYDDVPNEVVERTLEHYDAIGQRARMSDPPANPWESNTTPVHVGLRTLTPGVVASEAAVIAVPVLSAMGERDIVPDPLSEPRAFRSSRSVDLFVCPKLGHLHNFGSQRALFWERIHRFGDWCAALRSGGVRGTSLE